MKRRIGLQRELHGTRLDRLTSGDADWLAQLQGLNTLSLLTSGASLAKG